MKKLIFLVSPIIFLFGFCNEAVAMTTSGSVSFYVAEEDKGVQIKEREDGTTYIKNFESKDFYIQELDDTGTAINSVKIDSSKLEVEYDFKDDKSYNILFTP